MAGPTIDRLRTVAISQMAAPGTIDANFFVFTAPVLNNDAQVAFYASLSGPGVTPNVNQAGIWSERNGQLSLVVRLRDPAPGADRAYFAAFSGNTLSLNINGRTSFQATLNEIGGILTSQDEGFWRESSSGLLLVAKEGDPAPGVTGAFFSSIFIKVAINDDGGVAFKGAISGSGVGSNNEGLWGSGASGLQLIARSTTPAPGAGGAAFSSFMQPELNNAGVVAFRASLAGFDSLTNSGIWKGQPGNLELVVRKGDIAPATGGLRFAGFDPPKLNDSGQTAFLANIFVSDASSTTAVGIWKKTTGDLALVAREGEPAPGTVGAIFRNPRVPVLNDAGQTAFVSQLTGPGVVNSSNEEGVWSEGSGSLALVARKGDAAPGAGAGLFGTFGTPALNASGQTAFMASLYGNTVNNTNEEGIWAEDRTGALRLIARQGDLLDVSDDPFTNEYRTIQSLSFGGLNDVGQVVFQARFVDGSQGVFVSSVATVPKPASVLMLFPIAFATFAARRTSRARIYTWNRLVE